MRSDSKLQKKDSKGIQEKQNWDLTELATRDKKKFQIVDGSP